MIGRPMAHHALGRKADSDGALAALMAKGAKDWSYAIAIVYAARVTTQADSDQTSTIR